MISSVKKFPKQAFQRNHIRPYWGWEVESTEEADKKQRTMK